MSRFILSVLLFLIANLLTARVLIKPDMESEKKQVQEQTWTEWALADFAKQQDKPVPIVILGSSLVLTPVNLADAKFFNCTINGALHHQSDMLTSLLIARGENGASNFSFALPGLMPSDAYLINRVVLGRNDRHRLIIYGVGPRDFVDNLLASPASTDPYHCLYKDLNKIKDQHTIMSFIGNSWQSQVDYFLARTIPLYQDKEEIVSICDKKARGLVKPFVTALFSEKNTGSQSYTVADLHNLLPNYDPMSIDVNQALFSPNPKIDPNRFAKDLNEYRSRYGKINWDTYTCQTKFLVDFLKAARANGDKVLVLAMPITSVNRQLLPEYIFSAYNQNLSVLTKLYGANFLDLDNSGRFNDDDFGDTVHLSTTGSIKLIKVIADYIGEYKLLEATKTERSRLANAGVKI